jgi:peptidoglycan/LPS O-acetylase OafA/YrhL
MSILQFESHSTLATLYAVVLYGVTLLVAAVLTRLPAVAQDITTGKGRYGALDGFRGVLAVGVFVHHSFVANVFFTTGRWEWTTSPVLNHLGQTTVALFFMITGFLFALKAMSPRIDWKALYVSRVARLFPLYALIVLIVFAAAMALSGGMLREPPMLLFKELLQWLAFVCFGRPDINAFPMTQTLIAGVNWSLRYEVFFYAVAVPALFVASRWLSSRTMLWLSLAALAVLLLVRFKLQQLEGHLLFATHFLCGIVVACAYRQPRWLAGMQSTPFRWAAGAAVLLLYFLLTANGSIAIVITLCLFAAVVGGLSVFGLFHTRAALWLGDISYGIYLIHGLVLYATLSALRASSNLTSLGVVGYGLVMCGVAVVVVALASVSYVCLELPVMARLKKWSTGRRIPVVAKPA